MKILVIGSGAREHTLVWKLSKSPKVSEIYCAPGNAGIEKLATCVDIEADNIRELCSFAKENTIDLTVVGPEAPLVEGIVDLFNQNNLKIFGPNKKASQLEGSKIFAKDFMKKHDMPTAKYSVFNDEISALKALDDFQLPLVIKADGLAAGKGVVICEDRNTAVRTIQSMIKDKKFGSAGSNIVIEEYLEGIEISLLCFVNGKEVIPMESARDYKKVYDDDKGPNTGGMGCFSPNPILTDSLYKDINEKVLKRFISGLKADNIDFKGVIFIGLMITKRGPMVLEFNVRFGDPETEVVLPRLDSDLVDVLLKTIDGTLKPEDLKWSDKKSVCVILASGGYPVQYEKNKEIKGLDDVKDVIVFHGGTKLYDNKTLTNGGRVLAVTAIEDTIKEARGKVYQEIKNIYFEDMYLRKDIAKNI
ncbi:phosphoribosylamine--glycine ligase [Abyssisolibacter fermentans]|uniref:phosphoribosylamine--glycine ligase n=1 Tax=Abyssisolibacter fermentans TaxID=1766203 RepID=UPI0008310E95|nr:phosphoribosylamine--glycine ligase [Abyssisolibacter fermentans]